MPIVTEKVGRVSTDAGSKPGGSDPAARTPRHRVFLMSAGLLPTAMACMALAAAAWMDEGSPVPMSNWLAPALLLLFVASALGLWLALSIEERLAASARRVAAEAAVPQHGLRAQRREAVGQLSASVAHELNKLLKVISINTELLGRLRTGSQEQLMLAATMRSVAGGRELTQHLLRLGERRPPSSQLVYLAEAVSRHRPVIETALGRQVSLEIEVAADAAPVTADPADFELALVNLAFNAREAISASARPRTNRGDMLEQVHLLAGARRQGRRHFLFLRGRSPGFSKRSCHRRAGRRYRRNRRSFSLTLER